MGARDAVEGSFGASPGGVWMAPRSVLVAHAREAFDEGGRLKNVRQVTDLVALAQALVSALQKKF